MSAEPTLLLGGLVFADGPRWHDGRLWFSDMHAHEVIAVDERGARETVAEQIDVADRAAFACALGGADRRTLFLLEASDSSPHANLRRGNARIRTVRVDTAGAGLP